MKIARMNRRWHYVGLLLALASLWLAVGRCRWPDPPGKQENQPEKPQDQASEKLRPIRVAIFDVDVLKGVGVEGPAVTDQLNTMLSAMPQVTMVNRDQIKKVADEHQIALSGLVDNASAVKLGKFLSAQYIVVGRASKIGQTFYLVLKIVDVETTVQTTVSAKAAAESGFEAVLERLERTADGGHPAVAAARDRSPKTPPWPNCASLPSRCWARCCWCRSRKPTSVVRCAIRPPRWPSCSGSAAWDSR